MSSSDMLMVMLTNSVYSLPLILAWLYAVGVGGSLLRKSPGAGWCLIAAGLLELIALFVGLGSVVIDQLMFDAVSFEVFNIAIFLRSVVRVAVLLVSHTLLLMGIYGWRAID